MRHRSSSALVAAVLFGLSCTALADNWTIEESFAVKSGGRLDLSTDLGSVEVISHEAPEVIVAIKFEGLDKDDVNVAFDHQGADLSIDTDVKRTYWRHQRIRYSVTVPSEYDLDIETAGGSISVEDVKGKIDAETSGGSLYFNHIVGDIKGHTSGGSIDVKDADGKVNIDTSGGSIEVRKVTGDVDADTSGGSVRIADVGGRVNAETSGGSIRIENVIAGVEAHTSGGSVTAEFGQQPGGDIILSTSGGGVTVGLPEDATMTVSAYAPRIRSQLPVDGVTTAKRRLRGDINGGGPELSLETSGGNIYIERL